MKNIGVGVKNDNTFTSPLCVARSRSTGAPHTFGLAMNSKSLQQASNLVKASYVSQGEQALNGRRKQVDRI